MITHTVESIRSFFQEPDNSPVKVIQLAEPR
jgi:hypothetical protein